MKCSGYEGTVVGTKILSDASLMVFVFVTGKAATIPAQCSVPGLQSTETRRQEKENGQNLKAPTPVDETTTANGKSQQKMIEVQETYVAVVLACLFGFF